jgi:hypothetical protein
MRKLIAAVVLLVSISAVQAQTSPKQICLLAVDAVVTSKDAGYSQNKTARLMSEQIVKAPASSQDVLIKMTAGIIKATYAGVPQSKMNSICNESFTK